MKIAVAAMGKNVAGHFGHCENFIFFDTADGGITGVNSVPNPGHRPGFLPNFLADNGAGVVIAGSVGGGAVDIFGERGVKVILGVQGDAQEAVEAYLRGELVCLPQARARRRVRRASVIKQAPRDDRRAAGDRGAPSAFSGPCIGGASGFPSGKNTQGWLEIVREAGIFLLLFRIDL